MTLKEIQELIKLIHKTNLTEFRMKDGEFELSIRTKKYEKSRRKAVQAGAAQQPIIPLTPVQQQYVPSPAPAQQPAQQSVSEPQKPQQDAPAQQQEQGDENLVAIKSPIVGTFYRSPSPEKGPYVKVGDSVDVGDVVCIVEAMKLFNEIESEVSGKIVKVMVEDAQPVEYDQVLFLVDPKG